MEIIRKMNVPVEFLYETIIKSVLTDIHSHTGKELTDNQLTGFKYNKTFAKNNKATIQIVEAIKNKSYQYRTTTDKNDFLVSYQLRPLTEETCELSYSEKMDSYGYLQKLNDAFVGMVWSRLKKRRFQEMLNQIEANYGREGKKTLKTLKV